MKISELKMLGKTPNSDPDKPGRPHLVGVYKKEGDSAYVYHDSAGGYKYEIQFTSTGQKVPSTKSFKEIDQELRQQGYRSIIDHKKTGTDY